ncbi:DUF397 domain-containing protein [Streptomyces sp. Act-28]
MTSTLRWFEANHSGSGGGDRAGVATRPHAVHVRDSGDRHGGSPAVASSARGAFLADATAP